MKKIRTVSFLIVFAVLLSTVSFQGISQGLVKSLNAVSTESLDDEDESFDPCNHNVLYNFDYEARIVNGVYEENLVADLLIDVAEYSENHHAVILKNGVEITDGFLEQDMIVQIYHDDELYEEYVVNELLNPKLQHPQDEEELNPAANQHGFIMPLDNMNLTTSLSDTFGTRGGNHGGIDVNRVLYNGAMTRVRDLLALNPPVKTPIRAVKSGIVNSRAVSFATTGYGNCIKIDHGNGVVTVYAHMLEAPLVLLNQSVKQGDIIGYVGSTGDSSGPHLHFE